MSSLQRTGRPDARTMQRDALLALLVVGMFVALFIHSAGARDFVRLADFRAFYCAGSAVNAGRDPYLAEPLRSCEVAEILAAGAQPMEYVAMPAPLPGYSLGLFAQFARMPFPQAAMLYTFALIASLCITLFSLQKITGFPPLGILGALVLCDGWVSMGYGQIVAISLMFLCAAAALLACDRPVAAAYGAAGAMIEPHIALPACLALFLFERSARLPLLSAAALLAALSIFATGWETNVEYVQRVLPAHALAESNDIGQFSLTTLLHRLGVGATLALKLADLSYAAMVTFGLIVANRLYARTNAREILIVVPPAFTLFGGPFLHTSQMAVAVPALLVLMCRLPERRLLLSMALVIMVIPWLEIAENPLAVGMIAVAAVTAAVSACVLRTNAIRTVTIVLVMTAATACERYVRTSFPPTQLDLHAELARAASGSLLADATWAIHARSVLSTHWYLASHFPTWTGLLLMIIAASSLGRAGSHARVFALKKSCNSNSG